MTDDDKEEMLAEITDDEKAEMLAEIYEVISDHMNSIMEIFKPGVRVAVAVWWPGKPEQDIVMNHPDSTLDEVIATVVRRRDASAKRTLQ